MRKFIFTVTLLVLLFCMCNAQTQDMALHLDGVDDYVEVFDAASLDLTGPMTISLWYYFS